MSFIRPIDLSAPRTERFACWLVPLAFGLYSIWLGADTNWDLLNYHLYNPFAWLHGKLTIDLAPAGLQSYFNPLLDLFWLQATQHLPPRLAGFLFGALHGTSFVLLLGIARHSLGTLPLEDRHRLPLLLALAGCLTANFLSGLGNSMGDDTTALLALGGLRILVSTLAAAARAGGPGKSRLAFGIMLSGAIVGLGVGLKLTNACFAAGICTALLAVPGPWLRRMGQSAAFAVGGLAGTAATGGFWLIRMWKTFGNPLYPQFGSLFPSPLVVGGAAGDIRWLPRNAWEFLGWPFILSLHPERVGELPIHQIIWPIAYMLFGIGLVRRWRPMGRAMPGRPVQSASTAPARVVVVSVGLGFILWMVLFSVQRYLVAMEMLLPLTIWLLLAGLSPPAKARRLAAGLLLAATAVVLAGGAPTWGHQGWTDPVFNGGLPTEEDPERATVVIASPHARAWTWLATQVSPSVAFMQVNSSFPGTAAFAARMRDVARQRGGPMHAIIDGEHNWRLETVAKMNRFAHGLSLTSTDRGCATLAWMVQHWHLHARLVAASEAGERCRLALRADDERDVGAANREDARLAAAIFERNGFVLDVRSCVARLATVGTGWFTYQWCGLGLADR